MAPFPRRRFVGTLCLALVCSALSLVMFIALPAAAQSPAAQAYRLAPGDKIGIVVFGQPSLSGESTIDQSGNLRLPVVGEVQAANLKPSQLEASIVRALENGYLRRPVVGVKIVEFRPIYVLGMVRGPGLFPYREGETVLAAIARAGGVGAPERSGMDTAQGVERVRLLETSRAALLVRRARLSAQQKGAQHVDFPDVSGLSVDPARLAQIRDGEQRTFVAEREAEQQEKEALRRQLPRLEAEIASLKQQRDLELRQRDLNQQLVAGYAEIKREQGRIEGIVARLKSEELKAELTLGELQFKITELHNSYQRRLMAELRETDRSLLDLTVTLPAAQHAAYARQMASLSEEHGEQPAITLVRVQAGTTVRHNAAIDFLLQPGDVVQVGALLPPVLQVPADQLGGAGDRNAANQVPSQTGIAAASRSASKGPARTIE
jgi:polysaccharide export outer membrane protein